MLELTAVQAGYGPAPALRGVSLSVKEGEIVTLIGSNGAGKSTTLRAISRVHPRPGRHDPLPRGAHQQRLVAPGVRRGLVHIPEDVASSPT